MHFLKIGVNPCVMKLLTVFVLMLNMGHIQAKDAAIAFEINLSVEETFQKKNNENNDQAPSAYHQDDMPSE